MRSRCEDVAAHILPEIGQLQCGAGLVGENLAGLVAIPAQIQNQPAHGIGAAAAIVQDLRIRLIARHALILFKGVDQVKKWLGRQLVPGDRT